MEGFSKLGIDMKFVCVVSKSVTSIMLSKILHLGMITFV